MISSLSRFFRVREKKLLTAEDAEKRRGDRKKQGRDERGEPIAVARWPVQVIRYSGLKHNFDRR
jgi:hypothetical protein